MGEKKQSGFTIIETSMFLAISALLFVGLISGVSITINRQRFTDSTQSTHSFLQKQFNETLNVVNNRPDGGDCLVGAAARGASECMILGKIIKFEAGSDKIKVSPIIGQSPSPTVPNPTLQDYQPKVQSDDSNQEEFIIPWSAKVVVGRLEHDDIAIGEIAIIRSPINGTTYIFALQSGDIDNNDKITNLNEPDRLVTKDNQTTICLRSQDILAAYSKLTFSGVGSQDGVLLTADARPSDCEPL